MFRGLLKLIIPLLNFLGQNNRIEEIESLKSFVTSRSSYIAQVSLYGYLNARAGTRYVSSASFLRPLQAALVDLLCLGYF